MEINHSKTYEFKASEGSKVKAEFEAKIENANKDDLEEILHEVASRTHDFYLSLGRKIMEEAAVDTKKNEENWISITLPENCHNVCISFKREVAEMQIEKFGASPLYGFGNEKEDWLPKQIFITYGGSLAPKQRHPEEIRKELEGIKEILRKQINMLAKCSEEANRLQEVRAFNTEICRAADILIKALLAL